MGRTNASRLVAVLLAVVGCSTPQVAGPSKPGQAAQSSEDSAQPTDPSTWAWQPDAVVLPEVWLRDHDGARGPLTVVLEEDRIAAILVDPPSWPDTARVLDVRGSWLLPGLIDLHVHLFDAGTTTWTGDPLAYSLRAHLLHGVTSVVDAGGPPQSVELRDRIAAGELVGPDLKVLGPFVTVPGAHPCEVVHHRQRCTFVAAGASARARTRPSPRPLSPRRPEGGKPERRVRRWFHRGRNGP